jgi:hypothetical protein
MFGTRALVAPLAIALAIGCARHADGDLAAGGPKAPRSDTEPGSIDCVQPTCRNLPLPESAHAVRLTHTQWENTVRDLLHLDAVPGLSTSFPADPAPPGDQFGLAGDSLVVTNALWREYQRAAEALAQLVVGAPNMRDALLPVTANADNTAARVSAFVDDFLPRAYRRPVTTAEIGAAIALGDAAATSDTTSDALSIRVRSIISGVLQSPQFLYRIEGGEGPVEGGRVRLGPYELASKLAYALWGTMPDDALRGYAASGKLSTPTGLASVVAQMLGDARFEPVLADFHDRLFKLPEFAGVVRQTSLFPKYYAQFGRDAQEDVRRTIFDLIVTNAGTVEDLYTSRTAWVNASLSAIYGIAPGSVAGLGANPSAFVRVEMPAPRAGILSHVGWLAMEGKAKDPATILRGVFIARHVLCVPLGSPPPAAAGKDPSQIAAPTNRDRVKGLTSGCGDGCHGGAGGVINPLGFAFEEFDSLGALRTLDSGIPIDTSGSIESLSDGLGFSLPTPFADVASLMDEVRRSPWAHACYAAHWNAYLNETTELKVAASWLAPIVAKSLNGASIRTIIGDLVQQDAFITVSR